MRVHSAVSATLTVVWPLFSSGATHGSGAGGFAEHFLNHMTSPVSEPVHAGGSLLKKTSAVTLRSSSMSAASRTLIVFSGPAVVMIIGCAGKSSTFATQSARCAAKPQLLPNLSRTRGRSSRRSARPTRITWAMLLFVFRAQSSIEQRSVSVVVASPVSNGGKRTATGAPAVRGGGVEGVEGG